MVPPLQQYSDCQDLAWLWGVNPIAGMHWSDDLGWEFFSALAEADLGALKASLAKAQGEFVGVVLDDSSAVDNTQYLAIG
jgi:hypothetical protein